MNIKKLIALLMALVMVFSLLAGCAGSADDSTAAEEPATEDAADVTDDTADAAEAEEPAEAAGEDSLAGKKAAIIVPMLTVEALQVICENFKNYLAEYGIEADSASADVSVPRYIELIQNYVADDYDVLVIIPLDATGLEDIVAQAREAGTQVIMLSTAPSYEVDGGLMCDYESTGYAVAEMALAWAETVYANAEADSVGYAVVASETPEEYKLCKEAMISTIEGSETGYVAYVSGEEVGGSVDAGYNFAQEALTADPDIRIFVCNEPDSAKGIDNYLVASGLNLDEYAVFAINTDTTAAGRVAGASGTSVLRGLIPYGSDDTGLVASQIVVEVLQGAENYWVYDDIYTDNNFGWEYNG